MRTKVRTNHRKRKHSSDSVVNAFCNMTYDAGHHYARHHKGRTHWDGDPARGLFITPKMEEKKAHAHY